MRRGQFSTCEVCQKELERFRLQSDYVQLFLHECCECDETFTTSGKDLFAKYKSFCFNDLLRPVGKQRFFERLESLGVIRTMYSNNILFNIRLIANDII